mgnify:CR=1 FL=1
MVSNRITEGVGKKIVEALKQQSDIEIQKVVESPAPEMEVENNSEIEFTTNEDENVPQFVDTEVENSGSHSETTETFNNNFSTPNAMFTQPSPAPAMGKNEFASDLDGFEIPTNIAVLKQLINQLPAGVSRQTGAQIIKQTMEALGISMKSVLQEAQQVQESLNNSSKECQASILEYKKQINALEQQSQKFQRQYAALNDIISLFVQTSL